MCQILPGFRVSHAMSELTSGFQIWKPLAPEFCIYFAPIPTRVLHAPSPYAFLVYPQVISDLSYTKLIMCQYITNIGVRIGLILGARTHPLPPHTRASQLATIMQEVMILRTLYYTVMMWGLSVSHMYYPVLHYNILPYMEVSLHRHLLWEALCDEINNIIGSCYNTRSVPTTMTQTELFAS